MRAFAAVLGDALDRATVAADLEKAGFDRPLGVDQTAAADLLEDNLAAVGRKTRVNVMTGLGGQGRCRAAREIDLHNRGQFFVVPGHVDDALAVWRKTREGLEVIRDFAQSFGRAAG